MRLLDFLYFQSLLVDFFSAHYSVTQYTINREYVHNQKVTYININILFRNDSKKLCVLVFPDSMNGSKEYINTVFYLLRSDIKSFIKQTQSRQSWRKK